MPSACLLRPDCSACGPISMAWSERRGHREAVLCDNVSVRYLTHCVRYLP